MRQDADILVAQLREAVENCLPAELKGKIEYSVRADRFVLKSADKSLLMAFDGSLDLNPIQEGDAYCSTRVMSTSHLALIVNYLRENQASLVALVPQNYVGLKRTILESNWRVHAAQYPQRSIFPEILDEIPLISKITELVFFLNLLNLFIKKRLEEGLELATKRLKVALLEKWSAIANYYFGQFFFSREDKSTLGNPRDSRQFWNWIAMFKYLIEPAIRSSQVEMVYSEIDELTDTLHSSFQQESLVFFAKIKEALKAGELNIHKLNKLVRENELVIQQPEVNKRLIAIYRSLGVWHLRRLDSQDLPESNRYERYLSDGRRIALAPLRAANASSLFQRPVQAPVSVSVLSALGPRANLEKLTL